MKVKESLGKFLLRSVLILELIGFGVLVLVLIKGVSLFLGIFDFLLVQDQITKESVLNDFNIWLRYVLLLFQVYLVVFIVKYLSTKIKG